MQLLPPRTDKTFGAEWLISALAPTVVFLTLPQVNEFFWWLLYLLPLPTLAALWRTRRAEPVRDVGGGRVVASGHGQVEAAPTGRGAVFATKLSISVTLFGGIGKRRRVMTAGAVVCVLLLLTGVRQWDQASAVRELRAHALAVATDGVSARLLTGAYPSVNRVLPFTVWTQREEDGIVYEVTAAGDVQRFIASLRDDGAILYRNEINPEMVEARIITGDVTGVHLDSITIKDARGTSHSLPAVESAERNIAANDHVIAVANAEMTLWMSVVGMVQDRRELVESEH